MENTIYFKKHRGGLINQLMSIELAYGISHQSDSEVMVYSDDCHPHADVVRYLEALNGLIAIDVKNIVGVKTYSNVARNNYWKCGNSENEIEFAEGRVAIESDQSINLVNTLGWYSRFFFSRDSLLDRKLSEVRFRQEYYDFANYVSNTIGNFQGGHLRLTDHIKNIRSVNEKRFIDGVTLLSQAGLPIIICTDEVDHKIVKNNKARFLLIDDIILNSFKKDFDQLSGSPQTSLAIVSNLIMHNSKEFIGTAGSTYSAYIQRQRNQKSLNEKWLTWGEEEAALGSPFSWNGSTLDGTSKMWWREWPESRLNV